MAGVASIFKFGIAKGGIRLRVGVRISKLARLLVESFEKAAGFANKNLGTEKVANLKVVPYRKGIRRIFRLDSAVSDFISFRVF